MENGICADCQHWRRAHKHAIPEGDQNFIPGTVFAPCAVDPEGFETEQTLTCDLWTERVDEERKVKQ